ncbi:hypothetical protein FRZ67_16055 [Panacibacter ginsenosidivorans]|uniref:Uncharacterized protein n=1 Tax=Panacibacter ginsenosidivorans TaxID=1813871 RepID=A0A5B8VBC6_9BACT|nr:DUF6804 family protein [Panacibacter ginsenosidivorans]QEC68744.1 hypothetical protein FRZ67_16055 [Panacibacter ginsenosidivorans]
MKYITLIKVVNIIMLFGCLMPMPYSYYQIMRWVVCIGFAAFAYTEYKAQKIYIAVPCIAIAILFNPIAPIHFTKPTWKPIDITIACLLIVWVAADILLTLKEGKEKTSTELKTK